MEVFIPRGQMGGGAGWSRPGRWNHFVWSWSPTHSSLPHPVSTDPRREHQEKEPPKRLHAFCFGNMLWRAPVRIDTALLDHVAPLYLEIGVSNDFTVMHGQRPAIMVDEVILHSQRLDHTQRRQSAKAWAEKYHPRYAPEEKAKDEEEG